MEAALSMTASHARGKAAEDKIFGANQLALQAVKQYGRENVVNATIGAILNDNEELATIPTVFKILKDMPTSEIANYAPIAGLPDFLEAAVAVAFREYKPEAYIEAVATPGGSGAVHHTIWNYSEIGDTILTMDWFWGPYRTMAEENLRQITTFPFFDANDKFNVPAFADKVRELLGRQTNLVVILNSPAHNPTGYTMTYEEWEKAIGVLKDAAQNKDKRLILFADIAYLDYAGPGSRKFMRLFGGLPENMLVIVAFSMSKGYTVYGLRTGAMIGITTNKQVAREFRDTNEVSNRGTWSNGTRCGMRLLAEIHKSPELFAKVEQEREELRRLIDNRSRIFVEEAQAANLKICPFHSGFFISVPTPNPGKVVEKLNAQRIFTVALGKGVRIATCAIPTARIPGMAAKVAAAMRD